MVKYNQYRAGSIIGLTSGYFEVYGIDRDVLGWLIESCYENDTPDPQSFEDDYQETRHQLEKMIYGWR